MIIATKGQGAQLFVVDPIERLRPSKDSSVALMQAAQRAGLEVWACTLADLSAHADDSLGAVGHRAHGWVRRLSLAPMACEGGEWQVPDPWFSAAEAQLLPLDRFGWVWMRKDPPVDEAYLYATHLLDLASACLLYTSPSPRD